jgi:hypothetical protein
MPVIEMRESLGSIDVEFPNDQSRVQVVQKRINLKEGSWQRNMLQMDLFFDDFPHVIGTPIPRAFDGIIEFYVTPSPLILTSESIQLAPKRGPDASNNNVLYKAVIQTIDERAVVGTANPILTPLVHRFPQDFLATNANFPFFHDQLYLTMVFHAYDNASIDFPFNVRFAASMYMSYNEKKVKASRSAMGVISERFNVMIALNESNGRILLNPNTLQGDIIPAYTWGGIRPEYMVSASTLSQFWLKRDGQESELMQSTGSLRTFAQQARQMVANPDAFGTAGTAQGDVPDWFSTILPKGVEAGPVRPQFPPRVTQDDPTQPGLGNILMV